jgi:hypothetical protein
MKMTGGEILLRSLKLNRSLTEACHLKRDGIRVAGRHQCTNSV